MSETCSQDVLKKTVSSSAWAGVCTPMTPAIGAALYAAKEDSRFYFDQYMTRDEKELEEAGGLYSLHKAAIEREGLFSRKRIAQELAWRDMVNAQLLKRVRELEPENTFAGVPIGDSNKDLHGGHGNGWIGVDLDGTLVKYDGWKGAQHIGEPIPKMVNRVLEWMQSGPEVRIMTARVSPGKADAEECRAAIEVWLRKHIYSKLPASFVDAPVPFPFLKITHEKDHKMIELWDDRCVQVIPNTGDRADGKN